MKQLILSFSVLVLLSLNSYGEEPAAEASESSIVSTQNDTAAAPKRPRLKFKGKGPTCLCADGLSEKDILQQQLNSQRPQQSKI